MRYLFISDSTSPVISDFVSEMSLRGHHVVTLPTWKAVVRGRHRWDDYDLVTVKTVTPTSFDVAFDASHAGVPVLNTVGALMTLMDRSRTSVVVSRAGVPVPDFVYGTFPEDLPPDFLFPAILKEGPHRTDPRPAWFPDRESFFEFVGGKSRKFHLERDVRSIVPGGTVEVKCYVVGDHLDVVTSDVLGVPRRVPTDLLRSFCVENAGKIARVTGGHVFGFDVVGDPVSGESYVVDVNNFPSFIGSAGAPSLLADFVENYVKR